MTTLNLEQPGNREQPGAKVAGHFGNAVDLSALAADPVALRAALADPRPVSRCWTPLPH